MKKNPKIKKALESEKAKAEALIAMLQAKLETKYNNPSSCNYGHVGSMTHVVQSIENLLKEI